MSEKEFRTRTNINSNHIAKILFMSSITSSNVYKNKNSTQSIPRVSLETENFSEILIDVEIIPSVSLLYLFNKVSKAANDSPHLLQKSSNGDIS